MDQPDGSPTGSPQVGQVDGAELARRMMVATEAATTATQLATRALEELKTATEKSSDNKDWYKLLSKPASFLDGGTGVGLSSSILVVWIQFSQKRFELSETTLMQ